MFISSVMVHLCILTWESMKINPRVEPVQVTIRGTEVLYLWHWLHFFSPKGFHVFSPSVVNIVAKKTIFQLDGYMSTNIYVQAKL